MAHILLSPHSLQIGLQSESKGVVYCIIGSCSFSVCSSQKYIFNVKIYEKLKKIK